MRINLVVFAVVLLTAVTPSAKAAAVWTTIDPPGSVNTQAAGINTAGQIVGGFFDAHQVFHGFLLSDGVYTTIDPPSSTYTQAWGINDSGQISGSYNDSASYTHGFLLSDGVFKTLDFPKAVATYALGINNSGDIVGWADMPGGAYQGFLWKKGKYIALNDPKGVKGTRANGINDAGDIVGYYMNGAGAAVGFVLQNEKYRDILYPKARNTFVYDIANNRRLVGFAVSTVSTGFAFKSGWGFSRVNFPGGKGTDVVGINNVGQKVGSYRNGSGFHGFLKTP
jgi:probable HAF family extracellular repeat protein